MSLQLILAETGLVLPAALLAFVLLAVKYHNRLPFTAGHREGVHEPSGTLPLLGHTVQVIRNGTEKQLERYLEYSQASSTGTFRLSVLGVGSVIMIQRPEYIEYVQKTNFNNYPKGTDFRERLGDLLGHDGIFVADGDIWKTQRKSASHMFSARQFNSWVKTVIHSELDTISQLLTTVAGESRYIVQPGQHSTAGNQAKNRCGGSIVLSELFLRYTLSSFGKMAFAADIECLSEDPSSLLRPVPFAVAFDKSQNILDQRFNRPAYTLFERFSGSGRTLADATKTVKDFGRAIIERRLAELGQEKYSAGIKSEASVKQTTLQNDGKDLLALFMEQTRDPEALLTVVLNFIIAGRDTTGQTLSWLFYELCAHPEHVEVIREEVATVLGPHASAERQWLKYEDVKRLPYTLACIHETARLHPAVPKNGKVVLEDDVIIPQGPGAHLLPPIPVYKGERVGWSDWAMGRSTAVWGADAAEFNPTRFLVRQEGSQRESRWAYVQQSPWKFHVFNGGPRLCLGMNLANYEAVAFCAAVLPQFDFTWATSEQGQTSDWPPQYGESLTHPMKHPFACVVTSRS